MKTALLIVASLSVSLTACSFAARSPEMYRDDVRAALETKSADVRACYDGVLKSSPGAGGKVTVNFDVETETGKVSNVRVDKANTTAPDAVGECVTKNIAGVAIKPADERKGEGTWTYEFNAPKT
jgi:hypothetical protein